MHTFNGTNGTTIHFNSDMSGEVKVIVFKKPEESTWQNKTYYVVEIDGADILEFVAEHVRSQTIGKIESMSTDELLGL